MSEMKPLLFKGLTGETIAKCDPTTCEHCMDEKMGGDPCIPWYQARILWLESQIEELEEETKEEEKVRDEGSEDDLVYIKCRGCVGNSMLFWREGGHGYTTDLSDAWALPVDLATKKTGREIDQFWPKKYIDSIASKQVDMQHAEVRFGIAADGYRRGAEMVDEWKANLSSFLDDEM